MIQIIGAFTHNGYSLMLPSTRSEFPSHHIPLLSLPPKPPAHLNEPYRVNPAPVKPDTKVEMGPGCPPRRTGQSNRCPLFNKLTRLDRGLTEMEVHALYPPAVVNNDAQTAKELRQLIKEYRALNHSMDALCSEQKR